MVAISSARLCGNTGGLGDKIPMVLPVFIMVHKTPSAFIRRHKSISKSRALLSRLDFRRFFGGGNLESYRINFRYTNILIQKLVTGMYLLGSFDE